MKREHQHVQNDPISLLCIVIVLISPLLFEQFQQLAISIIRGTPDYLRRDVAVFPEDQQLIPLECVEINQVPLSDGGFESANDADALIESIRFTVDGMIDQLRPYMWGQHTSIHYIYSEDGKVIGAVGGPITACIETSQWLVGPHIISIHFEYRSQPYAYTWLMIKLRS